jgi:hypothetical protein
VRDDGLVRELGLSVAVERDARIEVVAELAPQALDQGVGRARSLVVGPAGAGVR